MNQSKRIVITGLGVISSIGIGWKNFWQSLLAGKSGISEVTAFDTSQYERHYAGEVKEFDPKKYISNHRIQRMGRASQFAIAASQLALEDARLKIDAVGQPAMGVCIGTTMGEPQVMEKLDVSCIREGKVYVDPNSAITYPASTISENVAKTFKLEEKNLIFSNACAAGNFAIGYSMDLISSGRVDRMLAGGADAFSKIAYTGFNRLLAVAPEKCQPFDLNRKGMIPAEGSGVVVIESLESAQKRNAPIYAEVLGYGVSCDAHHMTNPCPIGISKAIKKAMVSADINPEQVNYISAHGTGTHENDRTETAALSSIFDGKLKDIPVSSIKSMLGHPMGAASALESIACCLAIKDNKVPPTINFETPDPECTIDCVPNESRNHQVDVALNNSSAFGGNNCCLVLGGKS